MQCELCGKPSEVRAKVEGSIIQVCKSCAKYGEVLPTNNPQQTPIRIVTRKEELPTLKETYSLIIKEAREKKGLTQEQLAHSVKERVAYLQGIEQGKQEPPMMLIEKLERTLNINLLDDKVNEFTATKTQTATPTLGDVAVIKRRKKK